MAYGSLLSIYHHTQELENIFIELRTRFINEGKTTKHFPTTQEEYNKTLSSEIIPAKPSSAGIRHNAVNASSLQPLSSETRASQG